jgi:hypothetical protein
MRNTREVFMQEGIIKVCKTHGALTKNEVFKNKVCKKCNYQWSIKYESKSPESKEYWREYRRKIRAKKNIEKFNISEDAYNAMNKNQNGKCLICKKPESVIDRRRKKTRRLSIDHCHTTNKIRGLLCGRCNLGIGMLDHSINILKNAIKYLTEPQCKQYN